MHWPVGLGGVPGEHGEWADDGGGQARMEGLCHPKIFLIGSVYF